MRRVGPAVRTWWKRYRDAADLRSARAFHRAMGHNCSFCRYGR